MRVRFAEKGDENLYLDTWKKGQADSPWFNELRPYAPRFEEELDAARATFQDKNSKCLMAVDDGKAVGVLACRKGVELVRLGSGDREPAVLPSYRDTDAGIKLLDAAFEWSVEQGLSGVFTLLKLPPEIDPKSQWHVKLYFQWDMKLTRLAVQLGAHIHKTEGYANPQVKFKGVCEVGLDCLHDLVLRSFESTKNFEYDPFVHDPVEVRSFRYYEAFPDGIFVAFVGDEPVGFVFVRAPIAKDPKCGHIAAIGVVHKHRRKKIGMSLLQKAHNYIIEKGFEYSFVGTGEDNLFSNGLYKKMGYEPAYRLLQFVKAARAVNIPIDLSPHNFNELDPLVHPYEDRYQRVYNAGARFWETPIPTEELIDFVNKWNFLKGVEVIEFGCREGRDSIFLAKSGFNVTAVDIAPSAIKRAREWAAEEGVKVDFRVNDVTALEGISNESFDLGVNVGCLQMFPNYEDRRKHFSEAFRVLKPEGLYFLCNMAVLTQEEVKQEFGSGWSWPKVGELTPRKIVVDGKEKEILLPIIAGFGFTEGKLKKELSDAGFKVRGSAKENKVSRHMLDRSCTKTINKFKNGLFQPIRL